jgi:hypothetical protein
MYLAGAELGFEGGLSDLVKMMNEKWQMRIDQ